MVCKTPIVRNSVPRCGRYSKIKPLKYARRWGEPGCRERESLAKNEECFKCSCQAERVVRSEVPPCKSAEKRKGESDIQRREKKGKLVHCKRHKNTEPRLILIRKQVEQVQSTITL